MGDRTDVWFRFSGKIRRANLPELLEAIESQGGLPDNDGTPENEQWSDDNFADTIHIEKCNYAEPMDMIAAAYALGLNYIFWWASGGGYGPGYQGYFAITDTLVTCLADHDLEPMLTSEQLSKFETVEAAQEWLSMFENSEDTWPRLEIIDDEGE